MVNFIPLCAVQCRLHKLGISDLLNWKLVALGLDEISSWSVGGAAANRESIPPSKLLADPERLDPDLFGR